MATVCATSEALRSATAHISTRSTGQRSSGSMSSIVPSFPHPPCQRLGPAARSMACGFPARWLALARGWARQGAAIPRPTSWCPPSSLKLKIRLARPASSCQTVSSSTYTCACVFKRKQSKTAERVRLGPFLPFSLRCFFQSRCALQPECLQGACSCSITASLSILASACG